MKFIPVAYPHLGATEEKYILDCVRSSWISSTGAYIEKFEKAFANYIGAKYALSCNNGTSALHLALLALDIGPGDEVIIPAFTFIATANAVKYVGATPIFVDSEPNTWNLDASKIEEKITKKTKAIMPVHIYGYPAEMKKIMGIAKKHKLYVIEDAAEAHAAKYGKKYVGNFGDVGCFSFYGNKIITTGEGGMIITNKRKIIEKILLLKNHGMSKKRRYYHPIIGYNFRLTNLQAAIGLAQIEKFSELLNERKKIEQLYRKFLMDIPGVIFQPMNKHITHVCWLFSLLITPKFGKTRKYLMQYLAKYNIDSRPFFYTVTHFPMYKTRDVFPVAKQLSQQGINLPSFPGLSYDQIAYVANTIKKCHQS